MVYFIGHIPVQGECMIGIGDVCILGLVDACNQSLVVGVEVQGGNGCGGCVFQEMEEEAEKG